jgi:hypothetical protein
VEWNAIDAEVEASGKLKSGQPETAARSIFTFSGNFIPGPNPTTSIYNASVVPKNLQRN